MKSILLYMLTCILLSSHLASQNTVPKTLDLTQDTTMVELITLDKDFAIDVRYATKNNFTGQVLYDCDRVWLRKAVAMDLIAAHKKFKEKGYRIKIYDGYRPISVQWRLWKATPKKGYVSHPTKGMRMHNRGAAVDMTLIDQNGKELDMGTPYDFFGKEAHTTYTNLPLQVLANRKILKEVMQSCGFVAISNEWWHFDYKKQKFNIVDTPMCK